MRSPQKLRDPTIDEADITTWLAMIGLTCSYKFDPFLKAITNPQYQVVAPLIEFKEPDPDHPLTFRFHGIHIFKLFPFTLIFQFHLLVGFRYQERPTYFLRTGSFTKMLWGTLNQERRFNQSQEAAMPSTRLIYQALSKSNHFQAVWKTVLCLQTIHFGWSDSEEMIWMWLWHFERSWLRCSDRVILQG